MKKGNKQRQRQTNKIERWLGREEKYRCYYLREKKMRERGMRWDNRLHILSPRVSTVKAFDVIIHTWAVSLAKTLLSFKLVVHNVPLMDSTNTNITICINRFFANTNKTLYWGQVCTCIFHLACSKPLHLFLKIRTLSKYYRKTLWMQKCKTMKLCCPLRERKKNPNLLKTQFWFGYTS